MAANARRIGRPDAARTVASGSLQVLTQPLWISREAQKAMLLASEEGIPVADLPAARSLRILTDHTTGTSRAVLTLAQLDPLGAKSWSTSVRLTRRGLRALRWRPEHQDVVVAGRWLLGDARSHVFGVAPPGG